MKSLYSFVLVVLVVCSSVPLVKADSMSTNYFDVRDGITNSGAIFTQTKKGRVAFMGGSITEMHGWRALIYEELKGRFPETKFDFVQAGIASTDSTLGSFRLEQDVFGNGQIDLLFVEFAVNDRHNNRGSLERIRGMEGIIRHARTRNPNIDIIVQYFAEETKMEMYNKGEVPPEIADHDRVTSHYRVPAINLAKEVTDRINRGEFNWKDDFKNLHPSPFGHQIYRDRIVHLFDVAWIGKNLAEVSIEPHSMPDAPLDPDNYERGRYVDIQTAEVVTGWNYIETWKPSDRAATRPPFTNVPTLEASKPGAELVFAFEGTAVGILVTAGPDVGILDFTIDGKEYYSVDQYTFWSGNLHIPWAYMLAVDLEPGKHRLVLKTSRDKHRDSKGVACRIQQFLVN